MLEDRARRQYLVLSGVEEIDQQKNSPREWCAMLSLAMSPSDAGKKSVMG